MEQTKYQEKFWDKWLSERPENVRKVAEKIMPFKKYIDTRIKNDLGNRYRPVSYQEQEDGSVTVTCEKTNEEYPFLAGCNVFGMNPDNLREDK